MTPNDLVLWVAWTDSDKCFPFYAPKWFSMALAIEAAEKLYGERIGRRLVKVHKVPEINASREEFFDVGPK